MELGKMSLFHFAQLVCPVHNHSVNTICVARKTGISHLLYETPFFCNNLIDNMECLIALLGCPVSFFSANFFEAFSCACISINTMA